jgi:methylated-DNA-[protein]-cysteine S-methyltransferase
MTESAYDLIETPIGAVAIVCGRDSMHALYFFDRKPNATDGAARLIDPMGYSSRIRSYFDGDLEALDAIQVDPGGTPFQRLVWNALRTIPPGRTESYGGLAAKIGRPNACRAVGLANGQNPISLVIPCHRVIGSDGKLTGYGGGLNRKKWLLEHEGALPRALAALSNP